ncbi:NINE protein [Pedobacter sp. HMF7647]|uniref:NINE protein n=1 Tax=Hufsiella arboris TaxID=2695275 RepID=A0A7K1Y5E0_9SPHI|nr:TM2 domain-containing protein [Hufsiella arboris]MXV49804.1 NINE protein [Hufsiella arboris]
MMYQELLSNLRGISPEEFAMLQHVMEGMSEQQASRFILFYSGKRKTPQDLLLFTLLGFLGINGIQRFVTGQIGMGILYLVTGGLCLIGTIVDLINYRSMANDYNYGQAVECSKMARAMVS